MRIKTSITLDEGILHAVDEMAKDCRSRSEFIEKAVSAFLAQMAREQRSLSDLSILNRNADRLNAEAQDVLSFQGEV